uniref:Kinesin family member 15 n=1 Tax=Poecilia latipinna TaxID=48699 RepID=A0A3B3VHY5_9TELE
DSDSIKVFVRVRPLTQGTGLTTDGDQSLCLNVSSPNTIRLLSKPEPRTFTYDHVADMQTSQDSVFNSVAKNIVESCMNGYNGTIFAGQTGSGKTFTMLPSELDNFTDELRGVIPRSFEYLFFLIGREVERSGNSKSFLCKCSFIEIYNEQIYDLLDSASASLFLRENIKKGVFVEGAVEKFVNSAAEAYQVLSMGWRNRRVASTSMNRESSRSHAVFTMTLESKESRNEVVNIRSSQLNLVDLAGSERQKDTHTEGSRLKLQEASSINRSLMCLGQVIMALVDVSNGKSRHICYRDSKLTFLLKDSLGGNAKTYIIANVHPGSKCFGETLSTLQFAQRAKLIKNKAVINEDTQGNVKQLQAEVKKLKEQLVQVENQQDVLYKGKYMAAVRLWKKQNEEKKQILLKKVAQLEEAWTQKDKFIHSSRMIIRFREDHISRLEKKLKAGENSTTDAESQALIDQLKKEIKILSDQVDHHPKMTRYAAENYSLREENRLLRSLESVIKCEEVSTQVAAELEEAFRKALESEATIGKLNAKLLQKQSDLTAALQAFEEYKDITKQLSQLQSDKRYLEKSNRHLENILEATHACKKHEVSELNRIHVETIKILTTPTKAYNLRSRLIPLSSPEHLNGIENDGEDIWSEQPPSDMTEMALTEELRHVQDQVSRVQTQLNEEEMNNSKLLQQIAKLEEQIAVISQESDQKEELRSEIRDLRLVLQSSDKELTSVKSGLRETQREHQEEMSRLSSNLIGTQLQLDKVRLEWEQLLEQHRTLQDSFDQLQAEAKFDADQDLNNSLEAERECTSSLMSQLKENKENISRELVETMEQNTQLRKQGSDLTLQNLNLSSKLADLEQNLTSANGKISSLEQEIKHDKQDVLLDLMNQTRDLRAELSHKEENIVHLSGDIKDLTAKYNSACCERDSMREQNQKMQVEIGELKETMERKMASNKIEVEVLQEEITYATEEVERLMKVCDEQQSLLNATQEQAAQKELIIKSLEQLLQTPCGFGSFNRDLTEVLESQERELENRRSSMMSMELLLAEMNSERSAKNEEIQRLKLREKEIVRMEIQGLLEKFYLQDQESSFAQSQTCIQELTTELRNRCLELRELNLRVHDEEKLLQENEVLRRQNEKLSEENGKLVGHKNHKQRIEYLVKLKKDNTRLQE